MLQLFRSGLTSYFATALLVLLIASFALWGIGGDILNTVGNNVAQIGDEKVTLNDYAREFQNKYSDIQQQSNGEVTRDMVIERGLTQRWIADLVQRETFAYAAHDLNIRVTDNQLRDYIRGIEAFQDTLGEFSKQKFDSLAGYRGYTTKEFEEILRRDLERQYLMTSIVSGLSIPKAVSTTFTKFLMEERTAEIVNVPAFTITDITAPDDDTLKAYYDENSKNYMAPEYRDFRFIMLSTKDFASDVKVTDEEIEQAMGSGTTGSGDAQKRSFDQLLFDDKVAADKAYADLEKGTKFADLIISSGSTADDAAVTDNSMQDATDSYGLAAAEAIFTTEQGKYTAPVETDFGWRIFNITNVSGASVDKAKLREDAINRLKNEKALDVVYEKSELVNDELAAGASLEDIAEKLNLKVVTAMDVDASGYNSTGDLVKDIPTNPAFLTKAFELLIGDEPMIEDMDNENYYLMVVDNVKDPALRPFEDVKSSVKDMWMADSRKQQARKTANDIMAKTEEAETLEAIARANPSTSYNKVTLARNDQTGKVARAIQNTIFTMDVGAAKLIPAADSNGFLIVKVNGRKLSDGKLPAGFEGQLKSLLAQEYQGRVLSNYWTYLEQSLPVIVNDRAIKSVHDQLSSREQ